MKTNNLFQSSRRWTLGLLVAVLVTLSAVYTPVALQELAGVTAAASAYACTGPHTSGGDC